MRIEASSDVKVMSLKIQVFFRNFEQDILAKLQNIELSKNLKKKVVTQELKNYGCCPCMNIKDFHFLNVHEK